MISPILACEIGGQNSFSELGSVETAVRRTLEDQQKAGNADSISVYLRVMNSGRWFGLSEDAKYAPASLLKVFLMMGYFRAAETAGVAAARGSERTTLASAPSGGASRRPRSFFILIFHDLPVIELTGRLFFVVYFARITGSVVQRVKAMLLLFTGNSRRFIGA